jgi:hypothetical protein
MQLSTHEAWVQSWRAALSDEEEARIRRRWSHRLGRWLIAHAVRAEARSLRRREWLRRSWWRLTSHWR